MNEKDPLKPTRKRATRKIDTALNASASNVVSSNSNNISKKEIIK